MDQKEIGQMRLKQVGLMNGIFITAMLLFYATTYFYPIRFTHFFFVLGTIVLIQGVYGMRKGSSTKSIFPHMEKVAIYEKEKMGNEWGKQRKAVHIWNLILSLILFIQAYTYQSNDSGELFQLPPLLMLIIVFFLLVLMNFSMIFHFRKVDRSTSEQELKGYTWKSNLVAAGIGIVFALLMMVNIISYVFSQFN
ncbi:hypothetical protein ACFOZY_06985 [Chungangia koreensis]|uniref:Uncharacterized protein n=1 Tax=Chungangia koreensis TaxID=752657 RepID=A0ABV8X560_9LACT